MLDDGGGRVDRQLSRPRDPVGGLEFFVGQQGRAGASPAKPGREPAGGHKRRAIERQVAADESLASFQLAPLTSKSTSLLSDPPEIAGQVMQGSDALADGAGIANPQFAHTPAGAVRPRNRASGLTSEGNVFIWISRECNSAVTILKG